MKGPKSMDKLKILQGMAEIKAIAENEETSSKDFLPLRSYGILGDPYHFVIIGGRGTGKTRLFCTLRTEDGFRQIIGKKPGIFYPKPEQTQFLTGYYQADNVFPAGKMMEKLVTEKHTDLFWQGSVIFILLEHFKEEEEVLAIAKKYFSDEALTLFRDFSNLKKISKWIPILQDCQEDCEFFLDDIDAYLLRADRWVFLLYDSLDRICPKYADWFPFIRELLAFWFNHLHRWKRLKCKIFLRSDLYESDKLAFADSSKLKANILRLEWDTVSLYRLLLKKMANAGNQDMLDYLMNIPHLIEEKLDESLGYIPTEEEAIIKRFVNMMIGEYMGKDAKKGVSYSWVPNHLQDTHGILAPRSFLKCFSVAAGRMAERPSDVESLELDRILSPSMIQGAVLDVSEDRVAELEEEYPWLHQLKPMLRGAVMLMDKAEFIDRIRMGIWSEEEQEQLPASTPEGIFEMLQKLGIFFIASDGRVNVPEIYLHGFGMKRKGGLRRPK
jgi:hypothetical protein